MFDCMPMSQMAMSYTIANGHTGVTRLQDASFACIAQWLCGSSSMGLYHLLCGCTCAMLSPVMALQRVVKVLPVVSFDCVVSVSVLVRFLLE